jgi:hypothetical protein
MTEQRSSYHAFSGDFSTNTSPVSAVSDLLQCCVDGSVSRDSVLLLPIIQSPEVCEHICLHLVHLENGPLGLCNVTTEQSCPCCGLFVCPEHLSPYGILSPDETGEERQRLLCVTCAALPLHTVAAFRAFRCLISEQGLVQQ